MLLIAKHYIWSKVKSQHVLPGTAFEVTDQSTIDRYLSTGAAEKAPVFSAASLNLTQSDALLADAARAAAKKENSEVTGGTLPPVLPAVPPSAPENTDSALTGTADTASEENGLDLPNDNIENEAEGKVDADTTITDGSVTSDIEPPPYQIPGIGQDVISILVAGGYDSIDKVTAASKTDLVKIPTLGYSNANKIIKALEAK